MQGTAGMTEASRTRTPDPPASAEDTIIETFAAGHSEPLGRVLYRGAASSARGSKAKAFGDVRTIGT